MNATVDRNGAHHDAENGRFAAKPRRHAAGSLDDDAHLSALTPAMRELARWVAEHGRTPRLNGSDDPLEKTAGIALHSARSAARRGTLTSARRAALDALVPDWEQGRDAQWNANLAALARFHSTSDRFPSATSDDPVERRLALWLQTQRLRTQLSPEQLARNDAALDAAVPGWRTSPDDPRTVARHTPGFWHERLTQLAAFIDEHGTIPSRHSRDRDEASLSRWLQAQREAERGRATIRLDDDRIAALDSTIPNWRTLRR